MLSQIFSLNSIIKSEKIEAGNIEKDGVAEINLLPTEEAMHH
jgi:hypothetical protein